MHLFHPVRLTFILQTHSNDTNWTLLSTNCVSETAARERHNGCSRVSEQPVGQHTHKKELPAVAAELTQGLIKYVWYRYSAYEQLPQIILQSWLRSLEQTGLKSTWCPRCLAGSCQNCICCLPNVHVHSIRNTSCSQKGSLHCPFGLPAGLGHPCQHTQQQCSSTGSALGETLQVVVACSTAYTAILLPVRGFTMKHDSDVCCMQVVTMVNNQHYLYRMTVLVAITSLASVVSHETLYQTILPAVVSCAKDKVI